MCTTTRATHHTHAFRIDILAIFQHPVEQNVSTGSLIDVGTTAMMVTHLFLALAPAIQVEINADSTHTSQGA